MSRQLATTNARRKARLKGRDQDRASRRSRLERILCLMGLRDWCRHLSTDALDVLCCKFNPNPRVVPDPDHPGDPDLVYRAKVLQRDLDRVAIELGPAQLTFNDYHSAVMMLLGLFRAGAADRTLRNFFRGPAAVVDEFTRRHHEPIWDAYRSQALCSLSEAGGIDTAIYSARREFVPVGNRTGLTLTLGRTRALSRTIEADGIGRRAYRCGAFENLESGEIDWVEWDTRAMNLGPAGRLPVYIQSHALRQARGRLGIEPESLVDYTLWQSLDEPVLIPGHRGTFLAEYRILGLKVGYLVAEPLTDKVLIRTFLLVTMQGTPEGSELARWLGLSRPDIDHLELDSFGMLATTDLIRDTGIAELLRDCGCGGALEVARKIYSGSITEGTPPASEATQAGGWMASWSLTARLREICTQRTVLPGSPCHRGVPEAVHDLSHPEYRIVSTRESRP